MLIAPVAPVAPIAHTQAPTLLEDLPNETLSQVYEHAEPGVLDELMRLNTRFSQGVQDYAALAAAPADALLARLLTDRGRVRPHVLGSLLEILAHLPATSRTAQALTTQLLQRLADTLAAPYRQDSEYQATAMHLLAWIVGTPDCEAAGLLLHRLMDRLIADRQKGTLLATLEPVMQKLARTIGGKPAAPPGRILGWMDCYCTLAMEQAIEETSSVQLVHDAVAHILFARFNDPDLAAVPPDEQCDYVGWLAFLAERLDNDAQFQKARSDILRHVANWPDEPWEQPWWSPGLTAGCSVEDVLRHTVPLPPRRAVEMWAHWQDELPPRRESAWLPYVPHP